MQYSFRDPSRWQGSKEKAGGNEAKEASRGPSFSKSASGGGEETVAERRYRRGWRVKVCGLINHTRLEILREGSMGRDTLKMQEREEREQDGGRSFRELGGNEKTQN